MPSTHQTTNQSHDCFCGNQMKTGALSQIWMMAKDITDIPTDIWMYRCTDKHMNVLMDIKTHECTDGQTY